MINGRTVFVAVVGLFVLVVVFLPVCGVWMGHQESQRKTKVTNCPAQIEKFYPGRKITYNSDKKYYVVSDYNTKVRCRNGVVEVIP